MRYLQLALTLLLLMPCMFAAGYMLPYLLHPGITGASMPKELATAAITLLFLGFCCLLLTRRFLKQLRAMPQTQETV